jgi:hypothetical protein
VDGGKFQRLRRIYVERTDSQVPPRYQSFAADWCQRLSSTTPSSVARVADHMVGGSALLGVRCPMGYIDAIYAAPPGFQVSTAVSIVRPSSSSFPARW